MKVIQIVPQDGLALHAELAKKEAEIRKKGPLDVLSRGHQEAKLIQRRYKAYPVGRFWSATRRTGRPQRNVLVGDFMLRLDDLQSLEHARD